MAHDFRGHKSMAVGSWAWHKAEHRDGEHTVGKAAHSQQAECK